ncbi:DUF3793 family protein [Eubacterium oxidoreducens]|uniref:DUF3793 family protein n=1 Tax=Eubacterium oxidoreducens TaxID=1732 RepID=A0A1G6C1Q8_EUBOX|nr:DUF3793 family protein [Eubacterium oxidoreducens]SDB26802.1 Protein of unknown function [Eubacterium oxidoreducens]
MSREALEIVQKLNSGKLGMQLILQCAPLIAQLKVSNLLRIHKREVPKLVRLLKMVNVSYYLLLDDGERVTFLVFRKEALVAYLNEKWNRSYLESLGYCDQNLTSLLLRFRERYRAHILTKTDFPHEMGLFLGYPIEDVVGFVRKQGTQFLFSGYWKVYKDAAVKRALFEEYDQARECMLVMYAEGMTIEQILKYYQNVAMKSIAV